MSSAAARSWLPSPGLPRRWLPLAVFLLVFVPGLAALTHFRVIRFGSLIPFGLLVLVPLAWWVHLRGRQDLGRARGTFVALARMLLLGLLIVALAEPRVLRADERLSVVFAIDHSASIQEAAGDAALRYVLAAATEKPQQDEAGLVFFGRDAAVELPPALSLPFESINVAVDRDGTDIGEALSLSAALLPPDRLGRIVLLSDGVATEGALSTVLDDLASRQIQVDVLPIEYALEHEVWLDKLELPRTIKLGETIEPAVVLSSLQAGEGVLTLEERGKVVSKRKVSFAAGRNRFALPVVVSEPGYYEFVARIDLPLGKDRFTRNNLALASVNLAGKGKVLLVVDPNGDPRDYDHFAEALRKSEREVDTLAGTAFPREAMQLLPYDCIVFANVGRDAFDDVQMQAAHDAVFHQGSGFLMLGGQNSFGPGGWARTPVEELLPVSMDISQKKVMPKGALAIILHTCEFPQGNTWAKRITLQAIKVLQPGDEVGVLADQSRGRESWVFPLTNAGEYQRLVPLVNNAQIGDMPGFGTTMQMALSALTKSDASTKHVIIISDGDPAMPTEPLLVAYQAAKISVSTVTVFPHGNTEMQTMSVIAKATGGRHYHPQQAEALPAIFIKEAKTLRRSAIVNETFTPLVMVPSRILEGIHALPPLHGFVLTTPKPSALTLLEGPEVEDADPVLARWRYGIGVAAAFTSDLGANWGQDWVAWDHYRAFCAQLISDLSRVDRPRRLSAQSQSLVGEGWLRVEDHGQQEELLELVALVDGPGGQQKVTLEQTAPRRYEARFPLQGVGRYRAVIATAPPLAPATGAGAGGGPEAAARAGVPAEERTFTGFVVPFSQECRRFRSDPHALEQIARRTGGRVLRGDEAKTLYTQPREPRLTARPILDWLLPALLLLLVVEVAVRRLHIDLAAVRRVFARERAPETKLETLLARKHAVAERLAGAGASSAAAPPLAASLSALEGPPAVLQASLAGRAASRAAASMTSTAASAASTSSASGETAGAVPLSTTERLLAAKRRASPRPPTEPDPAP